MYNSIEKDKKRTFLKSKFQHWEYVRIGNDKKERVTYHYRFYFS